MEPSRRRTAAVALLGAAAVGANLCLRLASDGARTLGEGVTILVIGSLAIVSIVVLWLALQDGTARRRGCEGAVEATTGVVGGASGRLEVLHDGVHWHRSGRRHRGVAPESFSFVDLAGSTLTHGRWSSLLKVPRADDGTTTLVANPLGARRFGEALAARSLIRQENAKPLWRWLGPAMTAVVLVEAVLAFRFVDPGPFDDGPPLPAQRAVARPVPKQLFARSPEGSGPVIGRNDAMKVALAVRDAHLRALEERQVADLAAVTSSFVEWSAVAETVRGQPVKRAPGVSVADVRVPDVRFLPTCFLALLRWHEDGRSWFRLQVFERQDEATPWKIAFSTFYGGAPLPLGDGACDRSSPRGFHRQLAAYYQSWKDTGRAPSGTNIAAGAFSSMIGAEIAADRQDGDYGRGVRAHVTFRPATDVWSFSLPSGHLECGAVWQVWDYDAARQVRDRSNWGNELAPGHYDWLRSADAMSSCILEQGNQLVVYGSDGTVAIVRASDGDGIDRRIRASSAMIPGIDEPPYWR